MNASFPAELTPVGRLNVESLMLLNRFIYQKVNDRFFETWRIILRMQIYLGRTLTAIRTNHPEKVSYYLVMAFSWAMALANRLHLGNLGQKMWLRFPGHCSYCHSRPCLGPGRCKKETLSTITSYPQPNSLREWQKMFGEIYPHNSLEYACFHLAEEAMEVAEAWEHFDGEDDMRLFPDVESELIDVITFIFAVANLLQIDLAKEMEKCFNNGCPKCNAPECQCNYWKAKVM